MSLSSSRKLVRTITRAPGTRSRSARIASMPSRFGMTRSISTTSGFNRSACSIASSPSDASPATSMPSCSARKPRSPSRTTAWSSTTSTRIGSSASGHLQVDGGAGPRRGSDAELASHAHGTLLHRREPEPARTQLGRVGVEARAVVLHLEHEAAVLQAEAQLDAAGVGVSDGVLQRLLGDAQHFAIPSWVGRGLRADIEPDVALLQPPQHLHVLAKRAVEAVLLQVRRPQLEHQRAQLLERLLRELAHLGELAARG